MLRRLGDVTQGDFQDLPEIARKLSRRLATRALAFLGEPVGGTAICPLFASGEAVRRPGGVRRAHQLFTRLGIFLPPCWVLRDGVVAVLELVGLKKTDIERADVLEIVGIGRLSLAHPTQL